MNLTIRTRNGYCGNAVTSLFYSLITANSALFTSSYPLFPRPPLSPPSKFHQGYDRQAGSATGSFNSLNPKSKFLAFIH
jgi:hypothetical protein